MFLIDCDCNWCAALRDFHQRMSCMKCVFTLCSIRVTFCLFCGNKKPFFPIFILKTSDFVENKSDFLEK